VQIYTQRKPINQSQSVAGKNFSQSHKKLKTTKSPAGCFWLIFCTAPG